MATHLAQDAMALTLAAGATTKDAIIARHAAYAATMGEDGSSTMQDIILHASK
jgi:hypothetical protein